MRFVSTNQKAPPATLAEAVLAGLAPDGGLYVPENIPRLSADFFSRLPDLNPAQIAGEVLTPYLELPREEVEALAADAFNFEFPLVSVEQDIQALELFHGPTLSFKDFGGRFMARLFSKLRSPEAPQVTVLAATSGDTGTAIAHGFHHRPGFRVVILYPSGMVSEVQEKQLTTLAGNVSALEIDGTFDDCQRLVKTAFLDRALAGLGVSLTSANSISIARLLPQMIYYFTSAGALLRSGKPIIVSVPSGNFGNLTAGLIAKAMGLPITRFVASTNRNDIVPRYLDSGVFSPRASVQTVSNSMDVGNPSNFARMQWLYKNSVDMQRIDIAGYAFSDEQTTETIAEILRQTGYLLDPHGAVAYLGLKEELKRLPGSTGIFLETAHPAKFIDTVEAAINTAVPLPESLAQTMAKTKRALKMENSYDSLREYLIGPVQFS
jgi:threonine synthase